MKQNIFFTLDSSLVVRQKQIFYAVIALFIFSQFAGILNYKIFENLLIFLGFGLVVLGIYISMNRSKLKAMHWLAACFGVFLLTTRSVNEDFLLRSKEQISYLDFFDLLPMFLLLAAVGIFFVVKFIASDKKILVLADSFNVLLLVFTLAYCIVGDMGDFNILIHPKSPSELAASIAIFVNLSILFIALSEIFNSNHLYIRHSGFFLIIASAIFTLLNLYVFYNELINKGHDFTLHSIYLVPFFLLMLGAFYLRGDNKRISAADVGIKTTSKLVPIISAALILIKANLSSYVDLLIIFVIVAGAVISYFMKVLDQSEEIYNAEQNLHDAKNKEKHLKTNELEMINLSLEGVSEKDYLTSLGNRDSLLNELKGMCSFLGEKQKYKYILWT